MYRTSIASTANRDEIISFLERRGLVENAWLIPDVYEPSEYDTVVVCRRHNEVAGAACFWPSDPRQAQPQPYTYMVRMDAVDREAVTALTEAMPAGEPMSFWLFNPMIQNYFDELRGATREEGDLYFTVSPDRFRPVAGEEVVELTDADLGLFEGCERKPNPVNFENAGRLFAILSEGRGAVFAWTSRITPEGATTRPVITLGALYTDPRHRRQSLGKRLVSHVTEIILREGNLPMYWTELDNIASQRVCTTLGYWQYAQRVDYLWRKP